MTSRGMIMAMPVLLAFAATGSAEAQPATVAPESATLAISQSDMRALDRSMNDSADAWSRNDLTGFMSSYDNSPDTLYVGKGRLVRGYAAIEAMYAQRFGNGRPLGTLTFTDNEYRRLDHDNVMCVGRYHLVPASGGSALSGIYTLLFHRTASGWKITIDHTS